MSALSVCWRDMENIRIYEINAAYINYLVPYAPHLFHNRQRGQANERKYIGSFYRSMDLTILYLFLHSSQNIEKLRRDLISSK